MEKENLAEEAGLWEREVQLGPREAGSGKRPVGNGQRVSAAWGKS